MKKTLFLAYICLFLAPVFLFASDESLTITTYYPSPYGVYNQLEVDQLVYYKPQTQPLSSIVNPQEGDLAYLGNASVPASGNPTHSFYYYNKNNQWVPFQGGSAASCYTSSSKTCASGYSVANTISISGTGGTCQCICNGAGGSRTTFPAGGYDDCTDRCNASCGPAPSGIGTFTPTGNTYVYVCCK